ncbi:MAG: glyoxalase [Comamonadaceae bacterium]|nr:MAG: glyoxalase [Comamonadaceae bacterium]
MSSVHSLGYVVIRGPLEEWREFGAEVLGAQVVEHAPDVLRLRLDDRAFRILIEEGSATGSDSLAAFGFETADEASLEALARAVRAAGHTVTDEPDLAAQRLVRRLIRFEDLDGNSIEAYCGQAIEHTEFVSPRGVRFVTADLGVGHCFMTSANAEAAVKFYVDVLGFRLSDTISIGPTEATFLHCNSRHHSIALATFPDEPAGLGHLLLEVDSLEAVGRTYDRASDRETVSSSIGEHTNDKMTSFYVTTPSGFDIEYGWNGLVVDDVNWTISQYNEPSTWGHRRSTPNSVAAES